MGAIVLYLATLVTARSTLSNSLCDFDCGNDEPFAGHVGNTYTLKMDADLTVNQEQVHQETGALFLRRIFTQQNKIFMNFFFPHIDF